MMLGRKGRVAKFVMIKSCRIALALLAAILSHSTIMKISVLFLFAFLFCIRAKSFCQNSLLTTYKTYFYKDLKSWTYSFVNFKLSDFKSSDTIKFGNVSFGDTNNINDFYELYKPGLSFSSDSSKFIDIYSYWLNLEKKGKKIVANPEVDQAIFLCDLKNNKWTRVFFCGVSTRIDEAIWLTNKRFILAGTFTDENNLLHPKVLIGDVTKKFIYVYTDNLSVSSKTGYTPIKLKNLNIQDL